MYICIYVYIYMYVYICVCVCVCVGKQIVKQEEMWLMRNVRIGMHYRTENITIRILNLSMMKIEMPNTT